MNWTTRFAGRTRHMKRSTTRELLKLTAQPDMISFAGGLPGPDLFPVAAIRQAAEVTLTQHSRRSLQYGESEGLADLRDFLARRYSTPNLCVQRENVLITSGAQQALDLIGRIFLDEGDRVAVENPTYLALLSAWRPWGTRFLAVPADDEGLRTTELARLDGAGVKLMYLSPNFSNPRGISLSGARRVQLARWLRANEVVMVEDDPYGELRYEGESLPSLLESVTREAGTPAVNQPVIHVGTFSKVLAPGLRVGWVIAPTEVIDQLVKAKQSADLHTSTFCQHLVYELVTHGALERQVPRLRTVYRQRRDAMLDALSRYFPRETSWTRPQGGMFIMVQLPDGLKATELLSLALARQVAFVPGEDFFLDQQGQDKLRLNFSHSPPEVIEIGIRRLGEALAYFR